MDTPILDVYDARVWFPLRKGILNRVTGYVRAVDGVTFRLRPGETLGLVGESGCGKTTLGRAIIGLETMCEGRILFEGEDLATLSEEQRRRLRRSCQMIFQDPYASLNPRMTVMELVTEGLKFHGLLNGVSVEAAAEQLLKDVGMSTDAMYRYPHEFSGGQRQRINIARAISLKPRLVICDEPVSALDVSVQAQVINLLMDLREKYKLSYLFISHDLSVVRMIAQRVAVMYLGKIVEMGSVEEVMDAPLHPYTQALMSAVPVPGQTSRERIVLKGEMPSPAAPPSGCAFHPRCPEARLECAVKAPSLRECRSGHCVACSLQYGSRLH